MVDVLGYRMTFGVVTPSTNTVVQPEYDAMRPDGVTNHISRMVVKDTSITSDEDFDQFVRDIDRALDAAVDGVLTCRPQHLILGISAESIWGGGLEPSRILRKRIRSQAPYEIDVTQAADALPAALHTLGVERRIAVLTPYGQSAEPHIRSFFDAVGYEVVRITSLRVPTPVEIAHVGADVLQKAFQELNGPDIEGIVQFGANLPAARLVGDLEASLGIPIVSVNVATYWHALRRNGIGDRKRGFGRLLSLH